MSDLILTQRSGQRIQKRAKNGLRRKRIFRFFSEVYSFIAAKNDRYILALFGLLSVALLTGFIGSFRSIILFFAVALIVLLLYTKNFFVAAFLLAIFTFPFFNPNKYYTILVIRGLNRLVEFKGDYLLGWGVNISNIFLGLSLVAFVREVLLKRVALKVSLGRKLMPIIFSAFGFFLIGLGSSIQHSPFFEASFVWLLQYMQLFLVAMMVYHFFVSHKENFSLVYITIASTIFLQGIIAAWQFIKQTSVGLPIEFIKISSFFATGLDEPNALFRVAGTFNYHNQLGLIVLSLVVILAPLAIKNRKLVYFFACLVGILIVVLTQSRSAWISLAIVVFLFFRTYRTYLEKLIKDHWKKKYLLYMAILVMSLSYVVIPRILLSFNAFYEGAGIPIRARMVKEAVEALSQNPWLGYGVGTNEYVLYSLFPDGVMSAFPSAVHLGFIQLALEVGVLGLFFFLFPFLYLLRSFFNYKRKGETEFRQDFRFTFMAGVFVFFIYYLFQPHVGIVEFSYLGLILGMGIVAGQAAESYEKK